MRGEISNPTFSIPRDLKRRTSYFLFCVIFVCSAANFMFTILPKVFHPIENMEINSSCDKNNQSIQTGKDEFGHIKNPYEHDNKVNRKFCNGEKCKFLLAYYPPTMETSITNIEYLTYVKLAESLGRIMVLTNVGSTKISTCQRLPFNFYYDVDKLQENFPKVKFISQDEFQNWTYHRYDKPSTSHYYLTDGGDENSAKHITPYSDSLKKIWCLDRFNLNLNNTTSFKQLRVSWNSWRGDILENFLVDNLQDNSDVLLIRHDTRQQPLFVNVPPLLYSKHIRDAASKMINSLKPYIAIHWDVGHTKTSALSFCAPSLLSNVQRIANKTNIENIYFASDYPLRHLDEINSLNSTKPFIQPSHKWRYISEFHTKTMKLISSTISYHTADSLGNMKYLKDALKDEFENSGVRDIFDKLVLIEADWYIGLPNWPCDAPLDLKRSKMIAGIRNQIWKDDLVDKELQIARNVTTF